MKIIDIVNTYWKLLSFFILAIVVITQTHGRIEANELKVTQHERRIKVFEMKWQEFKQWIIKQEGRDERNQERFEAIQRQLIDNSEQNKMLLEFLLKKNSK